MILDQGLSLYCHYSDLASLSSVMADIRDVTPQIQEIKKDFLLILKFLKNPLNEISFPLPWSWQKSILYYAVISIAAGILNGLIPPNIYHIAFGLIFMPIITFVTSHILAGFFYYYFQVFEKRMVNFLEIFHLVILANIPFLLVHTLSSLVPPITLIGLAFSALLMIVGLTDKLNLNKKKSIQLVSLLYLMIFAVWIWEKIIATRL